MAETIMKYGARKGSMTTLRKILVRISSREIRIFPVPGAEIVRVWQNESDPEFVIAPSPREANVLLVIGNLTESLRKKAAITYMQIPRPRVLVFAGQEDLSPLPDPDIQAPLKNGFLGEVFPEIRELLRDYSWNENAQPWEPNFLKDMMKDSDDEGEHDQHHHNHNHGDHEEKHENHNNKSHEADDSHSHKHQGHNDDEMSGDDKAEDNHGHQHNHNQGDHDHGDMDFMSMVKMTKDLPRPKDGLPMNRSEVHFGPFHPGLPGGLSVFMELDGDTVIKADSEHELLTPSIEEKLPIDVEEFPVFLTSLNPLSPQTYRILANRSITEGKNSFTTKELFQLENDRVLSHLNWLAVFAKTFGNDKISNEAGRWYLRHKSDPVGFEDIHSFLDRIRKMPYLKKKLIQGPGIPDKHLHHLSGPVAKAAGIETDVRSEIKLYQQLGWESIIKNENNPWGRLLVRLWEIEQSLLFIDKAGSNKDDEKNLRKTGNYSVVIESPRGRLSLDTKIRDEKVTELKIESPSTRLAGLIPIITEELELSDALIQIASLDISPWEMQLNEKEG